jgi:hypothetical protein
VDGVRAAAWARGLDRKQGRPVFLPIRYADDWVVLVSGTLEAAQEEKELLEGQRRRALEFDDHLPAADALFEFADRVDIAVKTIEHFGDDWHERPSSSPSRMKRFARATAVGCSTALK